MEKTKSWRDRLLPLAVVGTALTMVGCTNLTEGATDMACKFSEDSVHCKQEAAVQSGDPAKCDKIGQKAEFKDVGSNPPQDKCIMMVAANKEDPGTCDRIKGGIGSYSKEDCLDGIAKTASKPDTCAKLSGDMAAKCAGNVGAGLQAQMQTEQAKTNPDQAKLVELQNQLRDLQKLNEMLGNTMKAGQDMQRGIIQNIK